MTADANESTRANGVELLVCAATAFELAAALPSGVEAGQTHNGVAYCVTGVGVPETYFTLPALLSSLKPKRILNIGIAGAYPNSGLAIADLILAASEVFGDVGFELPDEPGFRAIRESPFGVFYANPLPLSPDKTFVAESVRNNVAVGRGCTVNTCTGTEHTGLLRERLFGAHFETMEGAGVAQIAGQFGLPLTELRAISNIASRRAMLPENIKLALARLRDALDIETARAVFASQE